MRKYLLSTLLILAALGSRAQSINLNDLANLNMLTDLSASAYLTNDNRFKFINLKEVNGLTISEFRNVLGAPAKAEVITLGNGTKNADGQLLRAVNYTSNDKNAILALVGQAPGSGFTCYFRGDDKIYHIFLYESGIFKVNIYLKLDETSGYVEIKQKDIIPVY